LGKHAGEPASGGVARWKHVVLHCFRLEDDHSYRETPNRLKYMAEIRDVLTLDRDDLPDYSTIYKSFDRLKMWVWRALLRVSAQQHPQSGHAALDSTFFDRRSASSYFDRRSASSYYRQRSGSNVQTLKVTTLTDRESLAVLDVHISARWKHDTKTGPQVVRRNADDLLSVAADKAFHNWHTKYEFYALGVEPIRVRLTLSVIFYVFRDSQIWLYTTGSNDAQPPLNRRVRLNRTPMVSNHSSYSADRSH